MSALDFHSFSVALNVWLDTASEFRKKFNDHREMGLVAEAIVRCFLNGLHRPADDPLHPFNKYTEESKGMEELLGALKSDVRNELGQSSARAYVVSFFAIGGVNREEMDSLWVAYDNFAFDSLCPDSPNDEEADHDPNESGGEDDEVEEEAEEAEEAEEGWQAYSVDEWNVDPNHSAAVF